MKCSPATSSTQSSSKNSKKKIPTKRKNSDEVDGNGTCRPPKYSKVSISQEFFENEKLNNNCLKQPNLTASKAKKRNSLQKESVTIHLDNGLEEKKSIRQKTFCPKSLIMKSESKLKSTSSANDKGSKSGLTSCSSKAKGDKPQSRSASASGRRLEEKSQSSVDDSCKEKNKCGFKSIISNGKSLNKSEPRSKSGNDKGDKSQSQFISASGRRKEERLRSEVSVSNDASDKMKKCKFESKSILSTDKRKKSGAASKNNNEKQKAKKSISSKKENEKQKSKSSKKTSVTISAPESIKDPGASTSQPADTNDPFALLMMMEGCSSSQPMSQTSAGHGPSLKADIGSIDMNSSQDDDMMESDGSESMSDWEDVQEHPLPDNSNKSQIPDKPVEITMDLPDILKRKKKKKAFDWKAYFEQKMRRFKKEVATNLHKVHVLCLLAHGMRQNTILNDVTLSALILSVVPSNLGRKSGSSEEKQVKGLMSWYRKKFPLDRVTHASQDHIVSATDMMRAVSSSSISDARMWVYVFICLLRTVGFKVRLVFSFQPMSHKSDQASADTTSSSKGKQPFKQFINRNCKRKSESSKQTEKLSKPSLSSSSSTSSSSKSKYFKSSSKTASPSLSSPPSSQSSSKRTLSARKSKEQAKLKSRQNLKDEENDVFTDENESSDTGKAKTPKRKPVKKVKRANNINASDSEFEESPSIRLKKDLKIKSNRKVLSVSSEDEFEPVKTKATKAHDFWMELYVTDKKKWTSFDCFKIQFGKPYSLEQRATQPLSYVIAFRNDGCVNDVTPRYAKQWSSQTRKLRVDADWVTDTFSYFDFSSYDERILEEDDIKSQLLVRPMPTSIGDFKNHPLYALQRHLLKFEAIYPETAIPLGYIRSEPIYARECVRLLHSRDNWLREGRLVRLKEEPYKMVKSRPKWNKPKENPDELDLELFGDWQTEKYIPPPAVNGKVPKNDYGNVELFQPWMLPKGTVHLRVQGLQRVAKKLGVDVAPAMIGWDYHSGYSHPLMDGWVVCEEFADALLEAWDEDQENQRQREEEKKDKRVYGNWKRLIRGLLIKEKLKNKFLKEKTLNLAAISKELKLEEEEKVDFSNAEPALSAEQFWPRNRLEEEKAETKDRAEEYKRQLNKEREKRRQQLEVMEDSDEDEDDDDKDEVDSALPVGKTSVLENSAARNVNKSNSNAEKVNKLKMNKSQSSKSEMLSAKLKEDDKTSKANSKKKGNTSNATAKTKAGNKTDKNVARKRAKSQSDDEDDETYQPFSRSRKTENQTPDCTDGIQRARLTRSRQRSVK